MKVTLNPLVQSASGQLHNLVFQNRRGVATVTRFRQASNPKSESQQETRALFRHAALLFGDFDDLGKDAWNRKVEKERISGATVFLSAFVEYHRGRETLEGFRFVQSDRGIPPPGFVETVRDFPGIRITLNDFADYEGYRVAGYLMYLVRSFQPSSFYDDPPLLTRWTFSLARGNFFVFPPQYDFYAGGSAYYVADNGDDSFYTDAAIGFVPRLVG